MGSTHAGYFYCPCLALLIVFSTRKVSNEAHDLLCKWADDVTWPTSVVSCPWKLHEGTNRQTAIPMDGHGLYSLGYFEQSNISLTVWTLYFLMWYPCQSFPLDEKNNGSRGKTFWLKSRFFPSFWLSASCRIYPSQSGSQWWRAADRGRRPGGKELEMKKNDGSEERVKSG